jgi:hypothetical protein
LRDGAALDCSTKPERLLPYLQSLLSDVPGAEAFGARGRRHIATEHTPEHVARLLLLRWTASSPTRFAAHTFPAPNPLSEALPPDPILGD